MKLALLLLPVLFAAFAAAEDIAQLEQDQTANRDQVAGIQRERTAAWRELLTGPFQEGGGPADETARQLAAESKRLDMEGRARGEALKAEKDADELAALKIEVGALRRRRDARASGTTR